jgi:hypothetical protein
MQRPCPSLLQMTPFAAVLQVADAATVKKAEEL